LFQSSTLLGRCPVAAGWKILLVVEVIGNQNGSIISSRHGMVFRRRHHTRRVGLEGSASTLRKHGQRTCATAWLYSNATPSTSSSQPHPQPQPSNSTANPIEQDIFQRSVVNRPEYGENFCCVQVGFLYSWKDGLPNIHWYIDHTISSHTCQQCSGIQ